MKNKKYTPKFFKENMPEWKRKKDPILTRIFYRPLSFVFSSLFANMGITANMVSYSSILIVLISCTLLIIPNFICNIIGAAFVNVWLLSDCIDGNIARSVKKEPFGEFADSVSSYILVALLCTSLGVNAFFNGGIIIPKECMWMVFIGALASTGDTLMRLIYQKYKSTERDLADKGIVKIGYDKRKDTSQSTSLLVRIESEFGVGGILPLMVLIGVLAKIMDIVVIYSFAYYFFSCLVMSSKYIFKAIKTTKTTTKK